VDLKAFTEDSTPHTLNALTAGARNYAQWLKQKQIWFEITIDHPTPERDLPRSATRLWVLEHLGPAVPVHFTHSTPISNCRDKPNTRRKRLHALGRIGLDAGFIRLRGQHPFRRCPHPAPPCVTNPNSAALGTTSLQNSLREGQCRIIFRSRALSPPRIPSSTSPQRRANLPPRMHLSICNQSEKQQVCLKCL